MMALIRRLLPPSTRASLSRQKARLALRVLRAVARSELASSLYYGLFSRAFRREHRAVIAGRLRYADQVGSTMSSAYLLRRNVHRIEKGLTMRPRRPVFAVDYIEETVASYERRMSSCEADAPRELRWAHDVLTTYFEATASHPRIDAARERFARIERAPSMESEGRLAPFKRELDTPASVTIDALLQLADRRRSVRWFAQRPVPREIIDRAVTVALQSPSACNRQPYHFRIFDDPARVRVVSKIPGGIAGYDHNIPVLVVLVGNQAAYFRERDRHIIYIDAALAAMAFVLALEAAGLASCCINWPDVEKQERAMARELGLAPDERVVMLIALGYPDPQAEVPRSTKRALDEVRSYNV